MVPARTEEDFLKHCKRTVMRHPGSSWNLIMDQFNTHGSESFVRWGVATEELKLPTIELGVEGKSGILKSLATRREFLSSSDRRLRFIYAPKHTSWLNQVEIWFSVVVRRVLKQGEVTSLDALRQPLLDIVDYFNRTIAKPYRWTYTGQPLTS